MNFRSISWRRMGRPIVDEPEVIEEDDRRNGGLGLVGENIGGGVVEEGIFDAFARFTGGRDAGDDAELFDRGAVAGGTEGWVCRITSRWMRSMRFFWGGLRGRRLRLCAGRGDMTPGQVVGYLLDQLCD